MSALALATALVLSACSLGFHPATARPASVLRIMISDFDGSVMSFAFKG